MPTKKRNTKRENGRDSPVETSGSRESWHQHSSAPSPHGGKRTLTSSSPTSTKAKSPTKTHSGSKANTLLVDEEATKKWKSFYVRTLYTLLMIAAFLIIVFMGRQTATAILVFVLQGMMYAELVRLMFQYQHEKELPQFRRLYYYWFFVITYFVYGRTLMEHFELHEFDNVMGVDVGEKGFFLRHHTAISYALYLFGFISFVFNLQKKKHYKYQFVQFAYCHVALLIIVVQSTFLVYNMFQGMIWFFLPCSLVICNDVFAYIWGFFFGRRRLIPQLSPKKTWEGFIGAFLTTIVFALFWSRFMAQFHLMICPQKGFFQPYQECEPGKPFVPLPLSSYPKILGLLQTVGLAQPGLLSLTLSPIQYHAVALGIFASIVAPFGGFFASGFKRAFKIKDFGDSIPGHGGVTDRMDCQIIMGMFAYIYFTTVVSPPSPLGEAVKLLSKMTADQQLVLFEELRKSLLKHGRSI